MLETIATPEVRKNVFKKAALIAVAATTAVGVTVLALAKHNANTGDDETTDQTD